MYLEIMSTVLNPYLSNLFLIAFPSDPDGIPESNDSICCHETVCEQLVEFLTS